MKSSLTSGSVPASLLSRPEFQALTPWLPAEQPGPVTEHFLNAREGESGGRCWRVLPLGGSAPRGETRHKHKESWLIQGFHLSSGLIVILVEIPRAYT